MSISPDEAMQAYRPSQLIFTTPNSDSLPNVIKSRCHRPHYFRQRSGSAKNPLDSRLPCKDTCLHSWTPNIVGLTVRTTVYELHNFSVDESDFASLNVNV
jgi:hypothetical protein